MYFDLVKVYFLLLYLSFIKHERQYLFIKRAIRQIHFSNLLQIIIKLFDLKIYEYLNEQK